MECTVSLNKKYQDSLMTGIFNGAIKKNMRQNHRNVILVPWSLKSRRLMEIWPWTVQKRGLEHPEKQHGSSLKESELQVRMEMTKKARSGLYQYSSVSREGIKPGSLTPLASVWELPALSVFFSIFCDILVIKHYFHTWKELCPTHLETAMP